MRRILLVLALCICLAGCSTQKAAQAATPSPTVAAPAQTPKPTPKPTATPKPTEKPFDVSDLKWQDTPDSTAFSRIGYAAGHKVLGVVFRNSDPRIYLYYDFPQSEWDSFRTAESWGGYYNQHIKGQYESERVD